MTNISEILSLDPETQQLIDEAVQTYLHRQRTNPDRILERITQHDQNKIKRRAGLNAEKQQNRENMQDHHRKLLKQI